MGKYEVFVRILDQIRQEAAMAGAAKYLPEVNDQDALNAARAKAYIHLFLKVQFGLLDFAEREDLVTDGPSDGGIDGFFIDRETYTIFFIQSKFRITAENFESKEISLDELVSMDIDRVARGEEADAKGTPYNGKIKRLMRTISEIEDIGRYKYRIVIIANMRQSRAAILSKVLAEFPLEVFDYERCYSELVFPVVSGTYFNKEDLHISLDLSNKQSGTKISYEVATNYGPCDITVLYAPTIEVAKIMSKYRNSILQYNPRSYLDLAGASVNRNIRESILAENANEFALLNNGITMISDETNINEKIGKKNKAQLAVKNPQIINGGQTAYTLSRTYEELGNGAESVFANKEVMLKVITLVDQDGVNADQRKKVELIERISTATNSQTPVSSADRLSNENVYLSIQSLLFQRYGIWFERKRGEFSDGLKDAYVYKEEILERDLFFRLYLAANGDLVKAVGKRIFVEFASPESILNDMARLDQSYFGLLVYRAMQSGQRTVLPSGRKGSAVFGKIYAMCLRYMPAERGAYAESARTCAAGLEREWGAFASIVASRAESHFMVKVFDRSTGEIRTTFSEIRWHRSGQFRRDIEDHFHRNPDVVAQGG